MTIYLGYEAYGMGMAWRVIKAFDSKEKAEKWKIDENTKAASAQEYDEWGLVEGYEYGFFEMELE